VSERKGLITKRKQHNEGGEHVFRGRQSDTNNPPKGEPRSSNRGYTLSRGERGLREERNIKKKNGGESQREDFSAIPSHGKGSTDHKALSKFSGKKPERKKRHRSPQPSRKKSARRFPIR